jgi:DNA repair protein RAD51
VRSTKKENHYGKGNRHFDHQRSPYNKQDNQRMSRKEQEVEQNEASAKHNEPIPLELLQIPNVPMQQYVARLKQSGFHTVQSIAFATLTQVLTKVDISETIAKDTIEAAQKLVPEYMQFSTALDLFQQDKTYYVTTGSRNLDYLLEGGIESGSITEFFGEFRTGKTQLMLNLCVTAQLSKSKGGGEGKVLFIDSEGTFRPQRIIPIAERFDLNYSDVLRNIKIARAMNSDHMDQLLENAKELFAEEKYSMIILDTITSLLSTDYVGRSEISMRQIKLATMLRTLTAIATEYNIPVVITNQVVTVPDNFCEPKKPVGGHILAHAATTRVYMRKGRGETRLCKVYSSPTVPENETTIGIYNDGINDARD